MPILNPRTQPTVIKSSALSKSDMAQMVNQQTEELQRLMRDKHHVMALLCAIVRHPDAFSVNAQGEAQIEIRAIQELKENTTIKQQVDGDRMTLTVRESTYLLHAEPFRLGMDVKDIGKD